MSNRIHAETPHIFFSAYIFMLKPDGSQETRWYSLSHYYASENMHIKSSPLHFIHPVLKCKFWILPHLKPSHLFLKNNLSIGMEKLHAIQYLLFLAEEDLYDRNLQHSPCLNKNVLRNWICSNILQVQPFLPPQSRKEQSVEGSGGHNI